MYAAYKSDRFIVGLTNNHSADNAPVLGEYTLCGQYPGTVPAGATVAVYCTDVYQRRLRFRYVIVQFPLVNESMNVCEVEVFAVIGLSTVTSVYVRQNKKLSYRGRTARCVVSVKILPIATQQCRNYLYDKS